MPVSILACFVFTASVVPAAVSISAFIAIPASMAVAIFLAVSDFFVISIDTLRGPLAPMVAVLVFPLLPFSALLFLLSLSLGLLCSKLFLEFI